MKNKASYLLLTIIFFSSQIIFSQTEERNTKKFSLGVIFTPQFSNWDYKADAKYQSGVEYMDSIIETNNGFSFGFIAEAHIDNKSSIKSGLLTSLYPFESLTIDLEPITEDPAIPCKFYSFSGTDYFIDIPIIYKYSLFRSNRVNLFFGAGVINKFLFYTSTKTYCVYSEKKELWEKSGDIVKHFNYFIAASVEAGIEISLAKRLSFGFFPSFEYSLINIKKDRKITRKYYQLGLNLSMVWKM